MYCILYDKYISFNYVIFVLFRDGDEGDSFGVVFNFFDVFFYFIFDFVESSL